MTSISANMTLKMNGSHRYTEKPGPSDDGSGFYYINLEFS